MAISREDAINRLKKESAIGKKALSECENSIRIENIMNLIDALNKAISDMEKLQKIEGTFGTLCLSDNPLCCKHDGECEHHQLEIIKQILKEVE